MAVPREVSVGLAHDIVVRLAADARRIAGEHEPADLAPIRNDDRERRSGRPRGRSCIVVGWRHVRSDASARRRSSASRVVLNVRGSTDWIEPTRVAAMAVDSDAILRPWFEALLDAAGRPALFDAHTHFGQNDPDAFRQTPAELLAGLQSAGARGLVFAMHEPDGYAAANDAVLEAVAASDGRLTALCRVQPCTADALGEARRCMDLGAAGIKLHPRAEGSAWTNRSYATSWRWPMSARPSC
jgi:hypothetical protein